MKQKEWHEAMDHIDLDLVEEYVKTKDRLTRRREGWDRRNQWLIRLCATAACACLIVSAVFGVRLFSDDSAGPGVTPLGPGEAPSGSDTTELPEDTPIVNAQAPSEAPLLYDGRPSSLPGVGNGRSDIEPEFCIVLAEMIELLPDTYTFFDDFYQSEYRILHMRTTELLYGESMVDEFYFLLPVELITDFSIYDQFALRNLSQRAYEQTVVYNKTQACAERLTLPIIDSTWASAIMAYDAEGNFDERLWESTEVWSDQTHYSDQTQDNYYFLRTISSFKRAIADGWFGGVPGNITNLPADTVEVLKSDFSFDQGIYVASENNSLDNYQVVRYLNGFATNEAATIKNSEVSLTKARFEASDLENLPDLRSAMVAIAEAFDAGEITSSHIANLSELSLHTYGIFGWYAKTDNGVVGVVRVSFRYACFPVLFDDAYFIIEPGESSYSAIERDALLARLGSCEPTYIYTGEYTENGKIYDQIYY